MSRPLNSVPIRRGLFTIVIGSLLLFAAYSWVQGQNQSTPSLSPPISANRPASDARQYSTPSSAETIAQGGEELISGAGAATSEFGGGHSAGFGVAAASVGRVPGNTNTGGDGAPGSRAELILLKSDWSSGEDSELRRAARGAIQTIVEGAIRSGLTLSKEQQEQIPRKPTRFLFPDGLAVFYRTDELQATLSWMREPRSTGPAPVSGVD
jgi:hypothetical protein